MTFAPPIPHGVCRAKMSEAFVAGEEEVVETEEVSTVTTEEGTFSTETVEVSEDREQFLGSFVRSLELPLDTLQLVSASEEGKLLLEKVEECLALKSREVEEYESALNDFTQSMAQQTCELAPGPLVHIK